MRAIADTHTHTLMSGHAFGTVLENAAAARARGLKFMAVTDHASAMKGTPVPVYFDAQRALLPRVQDGLYLLSGCEANIMGADGALDLPAKILQKLDWVIASMHTVTLNPMTVDAHTDAWLAIAANPDVDAMGHMGDARYPFHHEPVLRACAQHGKIVEINAHSFGSRPGSPENCRTIAQICARLGVPVVVSSDAHFPDRVGFVDASLGMLQEIGFPEELILNIDFDRFARVMTEKTGRAFPEDMLI